MSTTRIFGSKVPIIFLTGGPGIGKRSLGSSLAKRYGFVLISTSQMLREEIDKVKNERSDLIKNVMELGNNLPNDIVIQLILNKMVNHPNEVGYLVIGFPREKHQALIFNYILRRPDLVVFLTTCKSILEDRLRARAITSDRFDDTSESIQKRLRTYYKNIDGALEPNKNVTVKVNGGMIVDTVFSEVCSAIDKILSCKNYFVKL